MNNVNKTEVGQTRGGQTGLTAPGLTDFLGSYFASLFRLFLEINGNHASSTDHYLFIHSLFFFFTDTFTPGNNPV